MKKSTKKLMLPVIIVVVLVIVGGIFLFTNTYKTPSTGNNYPSTNTNTGTGAKTYYVDIQGLAFSPAGLTINVGDTIIWRNKDPLNQTVTSDSGNELNSQILTQGASYPHTFTKAGTYSYHSSIYLGTKGIVLVQ